MTREYMDQPTDTVLPRDEQFRILLHKKTMHLTGSSRRRSRKYYKDQYRKTGVIPEPLLLAGQGILEGRKCSGRPRVLSDEVVKRFMEMVKASCDPADAHFPFISSDLRTIVNFHKWLEEEFRSPISPQALGRCAKKNHLDRYLKRPDFEEEPAVRNYCFKDESVFDLVQIDGSFFHYLAIRAENNEWRKPVAIEFYDTGSRYLFAVDLFFSESCRNSVELFTRFLLSTPFPEKTIRLRADQAAGFRNLMRPIHALNLEHSMPDGFYLQADFARVNHPKDKVHLESSHRALHHFEARIIKTFKEKIAKTESAYIFKNNKKKKIFVTFLDIDLEELRKSGIMERYRNEHNNRKHLFSINGKNTAFVPAKKMEAALSGRKTFLFLPEKVKEFMKYGFEKKKAVVSKNRMITFQKQTWYVAVGAEMFGGHQSTKVLISPVDDKLLIFEDKKNGIFLGEALPREPYAGFHRQTEKILEENELERIIRFLEERGMVVGRVALIKRYQKGLSLATVEVVYRQNEKRYNLFRSRLNPSENMEGIALFNAFLVDCDRHMRKRDATYYASGPGD